LETKIIPKLVFLFCFLILLFCLDLPAHSFIDRTPKVYIEVNIPATELTVYENGHPLFKRRVAIGQGVYPTPEQESYITKIEWNPWWYPPESDWA